MNTPITALVGRIRERHHRHLKIPLSRYVLRANPLRILTAPLIYCLIVPFVLLDLFVAIYQLVCFPIYGVRAVRRGDYFVMDRSQLGYLNAIEKLNCAYCSYANVMGAHRRYGRFTDYGNAEEYRRDLAALRTQLQRDKRLPLSHK